MLFSFEVRTIMILHVVFFITLLSFVNSMLWNNIECPKSCICREEHFVDLPISRYTKNEGYGTETLAADYEVSNDVLYEDTHFEEDNPLLRTITCILQADTETEEYISKLPKNTQALTLINSINLKNKTVKTSDFDFFYELTSLEIIGSEPLVNSFFENQFTFEIDSPITTLKYLNLENVQLKNLRTKELKPESNDIEEEIEVKLETITMIQKREQASEILPYYKYKEIQKNMESPFLIAFSNLILTRMYGCNLQNIQWEMFEGLSTLKYLILENNNLKFIPSFAFYGTPNLKMLSLAWNNLLNIQITDLAGLLELEYLDLSHNNFSQLSELSFPPFPKLKVADFRDNPITVVFPNTFDIMNTTDSIILGGIETRLQLLPNSFLGLNELLKLTINNVDIPVLKQELFTGMPMLKELIMTGNVYELEFDVFMEVRQLEKLILSNCNIYNISMDSFYGLHDLSVLDLSKNHLQFLPPNMFDEQRNLKELMLNGNNLHELPRGIFDNIPAKLIRLNENPWHCSCMMAEWSPMMINKIKQKIVGTCNSQHDKGITCAINKNYMYVYENRVAPKCNTPNKFANQTVFQAIRRKLRCKTYKLKHKKYKFNNSTKSVPQLHIQMNSGDLKPIKQHENILKSKESNTAQVDKNYKNQEPNELTANSEIIQKLPYKNNMQIYNKEYMYNKKKKNQLQMFTKLRKTIKEQEHFDNNL